jgi:hypothetical protein
VTGPYFAVETPDGLDGWTALSTLATDTAVLSTKIEATRVALGSAVDLRAAASIDFLGVAARVLSPVVGWAATEGRVAVLDPAAVWWRASVPGPMRLAVRVGTWRSVSPAALLESAVRPLIEPVLAAYRDLFTISEQVLWGNVASALNGAAAGVATARASALVAEVLSLGELAGTARSLPPRFVRNSCCLYYRVPGGGLCGDCVLRADR